MESTLHLRNFLKKKHKKNRIVEKKSFILKLVSHDYKSFTWMSKNLIVLKSMKNQENFAKKSCIMCAAFYVFALEVEVLKHESILTASITIITKNTGNNGAYQTS